MKDAFHGFLVDGDSDAVNPYGLGTKVAALYRQSTPPGGSSTRRLRLSRVTQHDPFERFDETFEQRRAEAASLEE